MVDLPVWITLAEQLAKFLPKSEGQSFQGLLPTNALLLLERFRDAYQAKDADRLAEQISVRYTGTLYDARTRDQLVGFLRMTLANIPWGLWPQLAITLYSIPEQPEPSTFEVVLEFHSRVTVLGVPLSKLDSGRVICVAKVEEDKVWRVIRFDSIC